MAPRSPKKKSIDGVVKPKKTDSAKASSAKPDNTTKSATAKVKPKKAAPFADKVDGQENESTVVSVEDTALAITIDDPSDQGSPVDRAKNDVAEAIENIADAKISEPAIDNEPISDESPKEDDKNLEDDTVDDGLVSSAILEDDVIDKNLDDLINDIENQDSSETELETEEKLDAEKPEAEAVKEKAESVKTIDDLIKNDDEEKAEKAVAAIENQEKKQDNKKKGSKTAKTPKSTKAKKPKASAKPFRIISRILAIVATGAIAALATRVATTGIIPNKYLVLGIVAAAVILFFILFKAFRNKTRMPMLIVVDILSAILTAASIFGFVKIDETMAFLNRNFTDITEYSIYDVVVSKKSNYNNLNDVRGKTFHSISDFVDTKNLEEAAKEQVNASITYESSILNLLDNSLESTTYISVINSGTYEATLDNDESNKYKDGLKIIGELKVKVEKKNDNSNSDLTKESSVIYLSGIDTRSGQMLDRSLSDVNIVITVNPNTKEILMTTIPRDYYIQLHGTSGLPDKLTHAGALGGIQLSMDTIGDLLNVDFDRYIRVNFNFVINLVDAIGGITVYSDVDYDVKAWTDSSCVFHPGNNNVDGKCALAFARERYAYSDGDRHRGRNQEQVIQKIFEKVSSSSTLISRYSSILDSLNGSFDTNISTSDITSLVNMQLSDMAKWTINEYNLDGTTGSAYTYSYPSQHLSVMFPNQETVDTAREEIHAVLTGANSN